MENLSPSKLTPGIWVSLVIGGLGSFYIITQTTRFISKVSQRSVDSNRKSSKCACCNIKVELDKIKEFITCKGCDTLVCRNDKCSDFIPGLQIWECRICHKNRVIQQKAGEWLLTQLSSKSRDPSRPSSSNSNNSFPFGGNLDPLLQDEMLQTLVSRTQREKVRDYIEELLAGLLKGPLDDVSVGKLYTNINYLPTWGKPDPTEIPHGQLKQIVQKVFEEAVNLPNLLDSSGVQATALDHPEYFDPKKYEQLVATAVLNKLAEFYQNDKNLPENSSGVHSDMEFDSNHNQLNNKDQLNAVEEENFEVFHRNVSARKKSDRKSSDTDESLLSDYLNNHKVPLPDLSHDSANDEDIQSITSNGTDATWEENWLFKTRKLKTDPQTPIAMLVPSPTEEVKALIGDKNADEVSDLSENSDIELDESEQKTKRKKKKSLLSSFDEPPKYEVQTNSLSSMEEILAPDSLISTQSFTSYTEIQTNPSITEAKNNLLLIDGDFTPTKPEKPLVEIQMSQNKTLVVNTLMEKSEINSIIDDVIKEKSSPIPISNSLYGSKESLAKTPELDFILDHIVSPHTVREHKKSIDDMFETLFKDDNNNKIEDEDAFDSAPKKEENSCSSLLEQLTNETNNDLIEVPIPAPRNVTPNEESKTSPVSIKTEHTTSSDTSQSSESKFYTTNLFSDDLMSLESIGADQTMKSLSIIDHSYSIDTNTSLMCHASSSSSFDVSDTFDSQIDAILRSNDSLEFFSLESDMTTPNNIDLSYEKVLEMNDLTKSKDIVELLMRQESLEIFEDAEILAAKFDIICRDTPNNEKSTDNFLAIDDYEISESPELSGNSVIEMKNWRMDSMEPDSLEPLSRNDGTNSEIFDSLEGLVDSNGPTTKEHLKTTTFLEISKNSQKEQTNLLNNQEPLETNLNQGEKSVELEEIQLRSSQTVSTKERKSFVTTVSIDVEDQRKSNVVKEIILPVEMEKSEFILRDERFEVVQEQIASLDFPPLQLDFSKTPSQPEIKPMAVYQSPTKRRYNSPLFENLADPLPIIKLTPPSIPDDGSISQLLYTTSLVSKSLRDTKVKTMISVDNEIESSNNDTKIEKSYLNFIETSEQKLDEITEDTEKLSAVETNNKIEITDKIETKKKVELTEFLKSENTCTLTALQSNSTNTTLKASPKHKISLTESLVTESQRVKAVLNEDPAEVLLENLIPGSIAERETKKYLNAAPIANNPYSAEALQKRLSETDHRKGLIEINNKVVDALVEESQAHESEEEREDRISKPITKEVDYDRYVRDYYINDAKYTQAVNRKRSSYSPVSSKSSSIDMAEDKITEKAHRIENGLFRAHPVFIRKENHLNLKSTNHLSKSEQDIHQLPLNRDQRLNVSTSSLLTSSSIISNRTQDDSSLNYSEDSDTTRIYDLSTRETKIVIPATDKESSVTPTQLSPRSVSPFKKTHADIEVPIKPKKVLRPVKPLSPETIEFFSPKKTPIFTRRKMEESFEKPASIENLTNGDVLNNEDINKDEGEIILKVEIHEDVSSPEPVVITQTMEVSEVVTNGEQETLKVQRTEKVEIVEVHAIEEKAVIEKEVAEQLPSVKKLAKIYSSHSNEPNKIPLNRPKSLVELINENENVDTNCDVNQENIVRPSKDSYIPPYKNVYHPVGDVEHKAIAVGHSITARSIPVKMRDELKRAYSNEEMRHSSPERPENEEKITPGFTRNSIAYFEQLAK